MFDVIVGMKTDLEMLKTAVGNSMKVGPIEEVDPKKGYRLKLGETMRKALFVALVSASGSGWQTSAGCPCPRGRLLVLSIGRRSDTGRFVCGGFSGESGPPSQDMAANVMKALGITISMKDGKVTLHGDFEVTGSVRLIGESISRTDMFSTTGRILATAHVHFGVVPGWIGYQDTTLGNFS